MADQLRETALFGREPPWHDAAPDSPAGQARAAWSAVRGALQTYQERAEQAVRDPDLSDRGKASARQKAARAALEALAAAEAGPLGVARRKSDKVAAGMKPRALDVQEALVRQLREAEVRAYIAAKYPDTLQREIALSEAIEKDDSVTVDALLGAPRVMGLLTPEAAAKGRQKWAERQHPEVAAELRQAVQAVTFAEQAVETARRQINAELGAAPDAIEMQAKGSDA